MDSSKQENCKGIGARNVCLEVAGSTTDVTTGCATNSFQSSKVLALH